MEKIRVAVAGYGHVGREAVEAVMASPDMELAGVILRNPAKARALEAERPGMAVASDVRALGTVHAAILAVASKQKLMIRQEPVFPSDMEFVGQAGFLLSMVTGQMTRFITDQPKAAKTLPDEKDESATVPNRTMS